MRILIFFLFFAGLAITTPAIAQTDSSLIRIDTTRRPATGQPEIFKDSARLAIEKMPRQAAIRSAILPGLGQIYNKRWWKVPFVYGGFVAVGLAYEFNQRYYREFLGEVQYRSEHGQAKNPKYAGYSDEGMIRVKDTYRRNRDLSILGFVAMHAVNIIDAYVDAKFYRFDVSDDLSFRVEPGWPQQNMLSSGKYVIKLNLQL